MRRSCEGKATNTRAAPHFSALREFGGTLGIDEFRKGCNGVLDVTVKMPNHNFIHVETTSKKPWEPRKNSEETPGLRLKRPRTIQTNPTKMDMFLSKKEKSLAFEPKSPMAYKS